MKEYLNLLDWCFIDSLAESTNSGQDGGRRVVEFPQAPSDDTPEVLLGFAGNHL